MLDRLLLSAGGEEKLYVEDVFSTYLYTGNGSTQTITNGIDLAGKGGMVWIKKRSGTADHGLWDTARPPFGGGYSLRLRSNTTGGESYEFNQLTAFNSNGFSLGGDGAPAAPNGNGSTYASWTFREAPKFFDVVTYTGTGSARTIAHSLGVAPGCIIVKRTDTTSDWAVYHRGNTSAAYYEKLNLTDAEASDSTVWNGTAPTASVFSVGSSSLTNASGGTYVAYVFAHDATSDGIIQCGSFTQSGGTSSTTLGWEPQWVLTKRADAASQWVVADNMRGLPAGGSTSILFPNSANAEDTSANYITPTATGFTTATYADGTYIYIAIRRGPMKTPTSGTSVFSPNAVNAAVGTKVTTNFPVDLQITRFQRGDVRSNYAFDRLRGVSTTSTEVSKWISTDQTSAETTNTQETTRFWDNTGFQIQDWYASSNSIYWNFRRAPGFFDEVCYTGTGSAGVRAIPHNLGAAPELIINKFRNKTGENWSVYAAPLGATKYLELNTTSAAGTYQMWGNTSPTATNFYVQTDYTNQSGYNFVTYLFASCPGVSKIGTYTGNGSSQTINCGFAAGARFVMIKRTDAAGDWYVWDTARGMVAANDPHLSLNSTNAEVTTDDSVDTDNSGFIVNQVSATNVNVNGATYVFLAVS